MADQASPVSNLAYMADPSLYTEQLQAQQRQQLANLLLQQGLAPMGGTESVGGVAIRRSPLEGAAKIAALLSGQSLQNTANQQMGDLMARQQAAMMQAFGAGPSGAPQGAQPAPQAAPQGAAGSATPAGAMGLPGMSPLQSYMAYSMDPGKYMDSYLKGFTPNDTTVQARQGGVDPVVANRLALIKASTDPKILGMQQAGMTPEQIYASIFGEAVKNAEVDRKAGNAFWNPVTGQTGMVPKIPEGANPVGAPMANGAIQGVAAIPGNAGILEGNTAATGRGAAQNDMVTIELPNGQKQAMTRSQFIDYANGQRGGYTFDVRPGTEAQVRTQLQNSGDFQALGAFDRQQAQRMPGVTTGQSTQDAASAQAGGRGQQDDLDKRFTDLRGRVAQSQTTNSYLESIKGLADSAATGKFSDKLNYVNSLLAPFSERATDEVTANNLLDKYANQITARLGQGGLGTDAARTLLSAAYPNAHMTKDAIKEAADNLMAANDMDKSKLSLLAAPGNSRNAVQYQQIEQRFDQVADPRVWQLARMTPQQAQAYLSKLTPVQQADLRQRAAALKQMGVF